jgi:hypothetical protein
VTFLTKAARPILCELLHRGRTDACGNFVFSLPASHGSTVLNIEVTVMKQSQFFRQPLFIGAAGLYSLCNPTAALAHVKWFAPFDTAEQPLGLVQFPAATWFSIALVMLGFSVLCYVENTRMGRALERLCDRATAGWQPRVEDLFRGSAAVFFGALAVTGDLILTPELKTGASWVHVLQAGIAVGMFWRSTLPLSALGIVGLFLHGIATHGAFHMMDYPVFLAMAAFFAISASRNARLLARRIDVVRYGLALSLMWAAVEKWAYPEWTGSILNDHSHLAMGVSHGGFIAFAGAVEFGLAFALLWTPVIRKAAALVLAVMMTAAIYEFGAVDAMGHLPILVVLVAIVAEPCGGQVRIPPTMRRTVLAPATQGLALAVVFCGYYAAHFAAYGPGRPQLPQTIASASAAQVGVVQEQTASPEAIDKDAGPSRHGSSSVLP